jgi:DNA-binding NtrC family response regulator
LQHYRFPGNLRELKNLIERAYILSNSPEIGVEDIAVGQQAEFASAGANGNKIPVQVPATPVPESFDLTELAEQTEKDLIVRTLSATAGVQAEAARRMGLSRSALAYKLNKYGIHSAR